MTDTLEVTFVYLFISIQIHIHEQHRTNWGRGYISITIYAASLFLAMKKSSYYDEDDFYDDYEDDEFDENDEGGGQTFATKKTAAVTKAKVPSVPNDMHEINW